MKNFVKNITNLVKVKTIVTLVVIAVFAVLALKGDIGPDNVMVIVSTVVAFYFGTQHEKKNTGSEDDKNV
jgi:multisubunit Na+/H+ antiporter MnhB subunit